ncbi:hypothetical protein AJ79_02527 [Helicocarpus griseus UAMH5409]|uniref:Uncharacterized protein n=1 Tax=Helicocarpus griseus UAMH5409 TaxID=1447875 RepID=A0A2B7Y2S8_9EURO|nr:hypothetical protein AJ79_02527 [Helicocarpus griseus UAMH5409]
MSALFCLLSGAVSGPGVGNRNLFSRTSAPLSKPDYSVEAAPPHSHGTSTLVQLLLKEETKKNLVGILASKSNVHKRLSEMDESRAKLKEERKGLKG